MAPWPGRGGAHRHPADNSPAPSSQHLTPRHVPGGPTGGRYRSASRVSEIDVWDHMQNHHLQGDSSSSDEDLHPRSHPDRPRHVRSVSHPFPSLFSSKKKRASPTTAHDDSDSESGVDGPGLKVKPPLMRNHRSGSSVGSRDFATGRCMTCGSLVRWPRELQTFRCTICMTINDLNPLSRDTRQEDATHEEDMTSLNFEPRLHLGPPKSPAQHRRAPSWAGTTSNATRREARSTSFSVPELDPKLLLLGEIGENGTWWTGYEDAVPGRTLSSRSRHGQSTVSSRSPHIDWAELEEWYATAIQAARPWPEVYAGLVAEEPSLAVSRAVLQNLEAQILTGQDHAQKALLKASETILKRPGGRITQPQDLRFLLIITANPLLHASYKLYSGKFQPASAAPSPHSATSPRGSGPTSGRHSVIIKRIVGLMSNAPAECHTHLAAWFARYSEPSFVQTKDLISGFLAYRLIRQNEKKYEAQIDFTAGLIPSMGPSNSAAALHAALGQAPRSKKKQQEKKKVVYQEDWQIRAAAQVLGFLFAANNMGHARHGLGHRPDSPGNRNRELVKAPGQMLATSDFYMTLLDDSDLVADFEAWERKQGRFSFCQHPFLLSIGAKIQILEHDARRQMETKARDAFFDSIMTNRVVQQFLVLDIRRECLVEDSLKAVSEVIGGGGEEIKKGLKINFKGEEGVDAGGLRKEWFLLLVREVFNPDHGMFLYDEDSHYCYFNQLSLEPSEQFFLVGVVLGLAIYNSTILDVALPPFLFRKLILAAPPPTTTSLPTSQPRQPMTYTLDDLAEYRPALARGLRQLLDYPDPDVESVFGLDFSLSTARYGAVDKIPLCPGGASRPVTNANRREYVDAYVRYVLDTAVARQFEPFKRGFYTVCAGGGDGHGHGHALSLFRPEEIELLVRGSGAADQPLDIAALKAVAVYDGWQTTPATPAAAAGAGPADPAETEETVRWFWASWEGAPPAEQRRLLAFITGSDRIPAMGAASLGIRVACLGEECGRFPTARTCFNSLLLLLQFHSLMMSKK
ncbi:hypothetical protein NEMBOFW57_009903 [Staphylotrichum longicolle]|uniref:HECT-type E3 ubiquitin transferase n=1 Tax=Staphylotrichum longicolle TaxID=669026 RepID=A0AAD4EPU8_9PEZI|nr:hypothetical protein NEMBOFW57_009903 [Staphylotrichum longicolle]